MSLQLVKRCRVFEYPGIDWGASEVPIQIAIEGARGVLWQSCVRTTKLDTS